MKTVFVTRSDVTNSGDVIQAEVVKTPFVTGGYYVKLKVNRRNLDEHNSFHKTEDEAIEAANLAVSNYVLGANGATKSHLTFAPVATISLKIKTVSIEIPQDTAKTLLEVVSTALNAGDAPPKVENALSRLEAAIIAALGKEATE